MPIRSVSFNLPEREELPETMTADKAWVIETTPCALGFSH
jgi:hypothetical protein